MFCLVLIPAWVLVCFVGGLWWRSLAGLVPIPGWTTERGSPAPWLQCQLHFCVANRFWLPATWLGATAGYKMSSPVLGSYSTHLSPCPGCPANLEMFPTLSEQDQMLLDAFWCPNWPPNKIICLFRLTGVCCVSKPLRRAETNLATCICRSWIQVLSWIYLNVCLLAFSQAQRVQIGPL